MCCNNQDINKDEDQLWLSSLSVEVDNLFLSLRKADQIVRHNLSLLDEDKFELLNWQSLPYINQKRLKEIIYKIPPHHLLADEYIVYMLDSQNNSIFNLIEDYNKYVAQRNTAQAQNDYSILSTIDHKLSYYIRRLGAMIHHLNIHLNLIAALLVNTSLVTETHQIWA